MTIWKAVAGFEGYEVSDDGRVRSFLAWGKRPLPRVLAALPNGRGYPAVQLFRDGHRSTRRVHQLVMETFVGPRPEGHEVRHLDGNKTNNAVTNLAYGTRSENMKDRTRHGFRNVWADRTHCIHGHPFDDENTYWNSLGHRMCRTCNRNNARRYYHARKAAAS